MLQRLRDLFIPSTQLITGTQLFDWIVKEHLEATLVGKNRVPRFITIKCGTCPPYALRDVLIWLSKLHFTNEDVEMGCRQNHRFPIGNSGHATDQRSFKQLVHWYQALRILGVSKKLGSQEHVRHRIYRLAIKVRRGIDGKGWEDFGPMQPEEICLLWKHVLGLDYGLVSGPLHRFIDWLEEADKNDAMMTEYSRAVVLFQRCDQGLVEEFEEIRGKVRKKKADRQLRSAQWGRKNKDTAARKGHRPVEEFYRPH
jgi:hypothetical protein